MNVLTTKETAEKLGVTVKRVQAMILAGRLPAERFGRALVINESDLALVADRKPGRPPKPKDEGEPATGAAVAAAESQPTKPQAKRAAKAANELKTKKAKVAKESAGKKTAVKTRK